MESVYEFDDIRVEPEAFRVLRAGRPVAMEPKAFDLLGFLIQHRGRLVEKQELLDAVWKDATVTENAMTRVVAQLRKALGDPAAEPRYIETVPTRGYRFIAPVRVVDASSAVAAPPVPETPPSAPETTPRTGRGRGRTMWLAGALAAAALALLISFTPVLRRNADTPDPSRIRSLAVLPLANLTGDPAQEYFSDAMTDALITKLASLPALRVVSRQSVMRYKGSAKPLPEIARELGVEGVVEGSVARSGGRVRISAQLVHATTDRHLWAHSYERRLEDVLALQGELARAIAEAVRVTVGTKESRQLMSARVVKPDAYDAYLLGRHQWDQRTRTPEQLDRALAYFQAAIAADPDFAPAHAALALTHGPRQVYGYVPPGTGLAEQKAAALKALELEPGLAEARAALGGARTIEWDWEGADAEFRRALELDPNSMVSHVWYGWHLQARGRLAEGADHTRRAFELDPLNIVASHGVARNLGEGGHDEAALAQWNRTLEVDPDLATTHREVALFHFERGAHDMGSRHLERARVLQSEGPLPLASLAVLHAASGNGREARRLLEELKAESARRYVSPVLPAMIHAALGENDQAFALFDKACAVKDAALISIQVGYIGNLLHLPRARRAALRADPRFDDLLRRMGLGQRTPAAN
jgi:TolB-like protein/DNA-binding winged helix-turn-helix (wHTH) protein/Flp pilus assembly protein TadD